MKLIKKELIFENASFRQCHASTVVLCGDSKIAAWFGGEKESANDVRIWYSRNESGKWNSPEMIPAVCDLPHWNPVLFETLEGEITLFYKVGVSVPQWKTYFTVTGDGGRTWSIPRELVEGDESDGRGPVKNKPLRHSSGILLAPASTERGSWRAFIDRFDGEKWEKSPIPVVEREKRLHMIQPTLWESEDGSVHALMRSQNGQIYRSDSHDAGCSWSTAYATSLPNNNSGIDCVKTDFGTIALVCNPVQRGRTPLSLLLSHDGGETFEKALDLETVPGEYSYPAIVSKDRKLFITYTYDRRSIAYAEIEL